MTKGNVSGLVVGIESAVSRIIELTELCEEVTKKRGKTRIFLILNDSSYIPFLFSQFQHNEVDRLFARTRNILEIDIRNLF